MIRVFSDARVSWEPILRHFLATDSMKPIRSDQGGSESTDLILRPCEARRLVGWTPARPCLWPSFETRARARSSGRGLIDDIDVMRTSKMETVQ